MRHLGILRYARLWHLEIEPSECGTGTHLVTRFRRTFPPHVSGVVQRSVQARSQIALDVYEATLQMPVAEHRRIRFAAGEPCRVTVLPVNRPVKNNRAAGREST